MCGVALTDTIAACNLEIEDEILQP